MPVAASDCDICSVSRGPAGIAMHFGQITASQREAGASGVALRHRVVLDEATAARLQDLLTALLGETANQPSNVK